MRNDVKERQGRSHNEIDASIYNTTISLWGSKRSGIDMVDWLKEVRVIETGPNERTVVHPVAIRTANGMIIRSTVHGNF